jgi:hypothetical protein
MNDKAGAGKRDLNPGLSDAGLVEFELQWKNTVLLDKVMATKAAIDVALADWEGPPLRQTVEEISIDLGLFLTAIGRWGKGRR